MRPIRLTTIAIALVCGHLSARGRLRRRHTGRRQHRRHGPWRRHGRNDRRRRRRRHGRRGGHERARPARRHGWNRGDGRNALAAPAATAGAWPARAPPALAAAAARRVAAAARPVAARRERRARVAAARRRPRRDRRRWPRRRDGRRRISGRHADDLLSRRRRRGEDRRRGESDAPGAGRPRRGKGPTASRSISPRATSSGRGWATRPATTASCARSNLDGSNVVTLVPAGGTYTPKQMRVDPAGGKLYWSDREGMQVQRSNVDGSERRDAGDHRHRRDRSHGPEPLVRRHGDRHGGRLVLLDAERRRQRRRRLDPPRPHPDARRSDLDEPHRHRGAVQRAARADRSRAGSSRRGMIYWADRGDDTINRAPIAIPAGSTAANRTDRQILVRQRARGDRRRDRQARAAACTTPPRTASSAAPTWTAAASRS